MAQFQPAGDFRPATGNTTAPPARCATLRLTQREYVSRTDRERASGGRLHTTRPRVIALMAQARLRAGAPAWPARHTSYLFDDRRAVRPDVRLRPLPGGNGVENPSRPPPPAHARTAGS